jgi:hypothetical protein
MTEWLVYRSRGSAGMSARPGPRPAPDAGLTALPEPAAEPGDSAAAGIVAG